MLWEAGSEDTELSDEPIALVISKHFAAWQREGDGKALRQHLFGYLGVCSLWTAEPWCN